MSSTLIRGNPGRMTSPPGLRPFDLERYRPFLLVLARSQQNLAREDASDLVQRTFLAAHTQQNQFRGTTSG